MRWLSDSKACMKMAEFLFNNIEQELSKSLNEEELDFVKVQIKSFLEQCRSPLDYIVNSVLIDYASKKNAKLYFPMCRNKKQFHEYMKNHFYPLKNANKELYNIIESIQPYHGNYSNLNSLRILVNTNKHNNLTQQKMQTNLYNASLQIGGVTITNLTSTGNGRGPISIDGIPILDHQSVKNNKNIRNFSGNFEYIYYFQDLNMPALSTLRDIKNIVNDIINKIEYVCI